MDMISLYNTKRKWKGVRERRKKGNPLSIALHKVIMSLCQTDVDCSCLHLTWNVLGSLGVGERNSNLTHMDAFGL